jgi:hypothetical protein
LGILSVLFGSNRLKKAKREQYFSVITAGISLQGRMDIRLMDGAGLVFNPVESSFFAELDSEIRSLLEISEKSTGTKFDVVDDDFGTKWVILHDPDFEDLVTTIHVVGETITEHGYGDRLLAAVFRVEFGNRPAYWIYNIKRGNFYPMVLKGEKERDNASEMRLGSLMEDEHMPVEKNLEQWYALWGIPF